MGLIFHTEEEVMNKILPIILVVLLSGCTSNRYPTALLTLLSDNENMSGRGLLCNATTSLGFLPDKTYVGKIFGFEFISRAEVNVYAYNKDNYKYAYYKETHAYATQPNQLSIIMDKDNKTQMDHIIGIERETLEARIVKVRYKDTSTNEPEPMKDSDIKKYGFCERNDDLNIRQYFDSLIKKERDIRDKKNKI